MKINEKKTIPDARQTMALVTPKNVVQTANRCCCGMRKHLRSSHLARQTNLTIYKTFIRPALLYGSKTWALTKDREENRLLVFERKVLRTIYGPKIVDGVYRSRYNIEFNSPNVIGVLKVNRLRYDWAHDKRCRRPTTDSSV
jgi:hypothetical protein